MEGQRSINLQLLVGLIIGALIGWFSYAYIMAPRIFTAIEQEEALSSHFITGTVVDISETQIVINTIQPDRTIRDITISIDQKTKVTMLDDSSPDLKKPISINDLTDGSRVTIELSGPLSQADLYAIEITAF